MKKNDFILMGILLFTSILLFLGYHFYFRQSGDSVVVSVDNQTYAVLPLSKNTKLSIPGKDGGENTLQIKNKTARIIHADCPDKLCVHQKGIHKQGETLVCLPHKVIITVISRESNHLDGISQ